MFTPRCATAVQIFAFLAVTAAAASDGAPVADRASSELHGSQDRAALAGLQTEPYSHPFCRAIRAASVRFAAPSLLIASER